jgi:tetratricopeptide (TPR) repeat protein
MRPRWLALAALLAPLWLGAAHAEEPPAPDDAEIARLEKARDRSPRDEDTRLELGSAYYQRARLALDRKDFTAYERYLGQAMDEMVESLRLDPESPSPHTSMGIVAAYQGNLDRALQSFANARRLEPRAWTAYTNLAETLIYRGSPRSDVEKWLERGERLGANPAVSELNLCLVSWRDGNLEAAERHFKRVRRMDPSVLESWNSAPVPKPIESLTDLMSYCCGSPACGPYLAEACKTSSLEVAVREIPEEVARRELVIEMERRRKLNEIYEKRKDLEIEVERPEETPPAPPTP